MNKELYRLKHTLYPNIDDGLTTDREEWDRDNGHEPYRKGTLWHIVSKKEYCNLRELNLSEDEIDEVMEGWCDFELIAYMKNNPYRYILLNTREDFELVKDRSE